MNSINGYIVELLEDNGSIKVYERQFSSPILKVYYSSLDRIPMPDFTYAMNRLTNKRVYRYKSKRYIAPKWINIVLLPNNHIHATYLTNLPSPKPYYRSFKSIIPLHIGPSFYLSKNGLCNFYINPNFTKSYTIKNQMDIVKIEKSDSQDINEYFIFYKQHQHPDEKSIIDEMIERALRDFSDSKTEKDIFYPKTQNELDLFHLLEKPRLLIKALRKHPLIEITGGGKHPYKATNKENNKSAPIPVHSKEYSRYFAKKITKELGIPFESII